MQKVDNSKDPRMKLVWQHKGIKWFTYMNPLDIDAVRGIAAEQADRHIGMMISKDDLILAIEKIKEHAKKMEIVDAFAIVHDIGHRTKLFCEENSILELANVYFFLQDESPSTYLDSFRKKKQEIWDQDPVARAFFLRMGLGLTKKLSNMSVEDSVTYMEKTKATSERLYRHIPRPADQKKNTSDTSTD